MQALAQGASPAYKVSARAVKSRVVVGKDELKFQISSQRDGFAYVFLLASGGEMTMLFPNALDKRNRIRAGETLALPRASWPVGAVGPPGTNYFAVLVSARERDFSKAGIGYKGVFPEFSVAALTELDAARGSGPSPLLGAPHCSTMPSCDESWGVAYFEIVETR